MTEIVYVFDPEQNKFFDLSKSCHRLHALGSEGSEGLSEQNSIPKENQIPDEKDYQIDEFVAKKHEMEKIFKEVSAEIDQQKFASLLKPAEKMRILNKQKDNELEPGRMARANSLAPKKAPNSSKFHGLVYIPVAFIALFLDFAIIVVLLIYDFFTILGFWLMMNLAILILLVLYMSGCIFRGGEGEEEKKAESEVSVKVDEIDEEPSPRHTFREHQLDISESYYPRNSLEMEERGFEGGESQNLNNPKKRRKTKVARLQLSDVINNSARKLMLCQNLVRNRENKLLGILNSKRKRVQENDKNDRKSTRVGWIMSVDSFSPSKAANLSKIEKLEKSNNQTVEVPKAKLRLLERNIRNLRALNPNDLRQKMSNFHLKPKIKKFNPEASTTPKQPIQRSITVTEPSSNKKKGQKGALNPELLLIKFSKKINFPNPSLREINNNTARADLGECELSSLSDRPHSCYGNKFLRFKKPKTLRSIRKVEFVSFVDINKQRLASPSNNTRKRLDFEYYTVFENESKFLPRSGFEDSNAPRTDRIGWKERPGDRFAGYMSQRLEYGEKSYGVDFNSSLKELRQSEEAEGPGRKLPEPNFFQGGNQSSRYTDSRFLDRGADFRKGDRFMRAVKPTALPPSKDDLDD